MDQNKDFSNLKNQIFHQILQQKHLIILILLRVRLGRC